MIHDFKGVAVSKSLMLCILLWFSVALPICGMNSPMQAEFPFLRIMVISFGVIFSCILPLCYFILSLYHRCPRCKASWCYGPDSDKIVDVTYNYVTDDNKAETKIKIRKERILKQKRCTACGHTKLTPKINIIRESI